MDRTTDIYVSLLNEGVTVWRPIPARKLGDGSYIIQGHDDDDPDVETWRFPAGANVICEKRRVDGGENLAAVKVKGQRRRTA